MNRCNSVNSAKQLAYLKTESLHLVVINWEKSETDQKLADRHCCISFDLIKSILNCTSPTIAFQWYLILRLWFRNFRTDRAWHPFNGGHVSSPVYHRGLYSWLEVLLDLGKNAFISCTSRFSARVFVITYTTYGGWHWIHSLAICKYDSSILCKANSSRGKKNYGGWNCAIFLIAILNYKQFHGKLGPLLREQVF